MVEIVQGENLDVLRTLDDGRFALVYADPPFNTGKRRRHEGTEARRHEGSGGVGVYRGFGGAAYERVATGDARSYADSFDDYMAFLEPRLREIRRVLAPTGSLFFHIDPRESHYCKVLLDSIFGRDSFMNEIVWAYDFGGRPRTRWPAKHDVIFWYAMDPRRYTFNREAMDRIPYMAPGLAGPEKASRGKTPTDVWWNTIVSPTGREKTGYPTQKPLAILDRILRVHTDEGDEVLDCFAGSGTTGEASARLGRRCLLVDENPQAIEVMRRRLGAPADEAAGRS